MKKVLLVLLLVILLVVIVNSCDTGATVERSGKVVGTYLVGANTFFIDGNLTREEAHNVLDELYSKKGE